MAFARAVVDKLQYVHHETRSHDYIRRYTSLTRDIPEETVWTILQDSLQGITLDQSQFDCLFAIGDDDHDGKADYDDVWHMIEAACVIAGVEGM